MGENWSRPVDVCGQAAAVTLAKSRVSGEGFVDGEGRGGGEGEERTIVLCFADALPGLGGLRGTEPQVSHGRGSKGDAQKLPGRVTQLDAFQGSLLDRHLEGSKACIRSPNQRNRQQQNYRLHHTQQPTKDECCRRRTRAAIADPMIIAASWRLAATPVSGPLGCGGC